MPRLSNFTAAPDKEGSPRGKSGSGDRKPRLDAALEQTEAFHARDRLSPAADPQLPVQPVVVPLDGMQAEARARRQSADPIVQRTVAAKWLLRVRSVCPVTGLSLSCAHSFTDEDVVVYKTILRYLARLFHAYFHTFGWMHSTSCSLYYGRREPYWRESSALGEREGMAIKEGEGKR